MLTEKQQAGFYWSSRVLILLAAISGALAGFGFMPPIGIQVAGATAALAGIAARWCEQHLPPNKGDIGEVE